MRKKFSKNQYGDDEQGTCVLYDRPSFSDSICTLHMGKYPYEFMVHLHIYVQVSI